MPPARPPHQGASDKREFPASPETTRFYILHGDDELAVDKALNELKNRLAGESVGAGGADMGGLNTHVLSAAQLTFGALRHECDTLPFLFGRRVVIVRGLLSRIAPKRKSREEEAAEHEDPAWKRAFMVELLAYLPGLPETTRLIFVEDELLDPSHRVLKLARDWESRREAEVLERRRPSDGQLPGKIMELVRSYRGEISTEAAKLLGDLVGPDMRLLESEVEKLLAYAEGRRITNQDVQLLVSQAREAVIFELTDCMARHETGRALRTAHQLLDDGAEPLYILSMLARQVRILIQVGALRSERMGEQEIVSRLGLHPYVVEKALAQVRGFSMAKLEAAHRRLVLTDWAVKTGEIEPPLALDMLVIELSR